MAKSLIYKQINQEKENNKVSNRAGYKSTTTFL